LNGCNGREAVIPDLLALERICAEAAVITFDLLME